MKIKHLLTKTLLVAAGLLLGGANSVWAGDVTTLYEKGTTGHDWAAADLTDWVLSGTAESSIDAKGLKFAKTAAARTEYTYTKSLTTTENAKVSMDLEWIVENANGSATAGCSVIFGDVMLFWSGQNRDLKITIGGNETSLISSGAAALRGTTFNVNIVIDKATKEVEYSISNSAYNSGTAIEGKGTASSSNISSVAFRWSRGGQQNVSSQIVKSILITEEEQTVTATSYTVNYKLGENVVKTVSSDGVVDQVITADVAVDGTETGYEGKHYLITAGSAPSMTLVAAAASNVLDVPVRAPYTATLTVTKNIGGEAQTPEVTNLVETDEKVCSWIYAYPMYVEKGGVYYIADETTTFGESGTFTDGQSISKTVNYATAATDVVWFKDINAGSVSDVAYSGGSYTNTSEELANVTVDAGVYEVIFNVVSKAGSGGSHRNEGVSVNGTNVANLEGNVNGLRTLTITVTSDASTITAYGNGASNYTDNLDYVLIRKTADLPSTENIVVTDAGYATYVSNYNLDFTSATTKAYKVHVAEKGVATMTEVAKVPAKTPVLLYVAGGNGEGEAIPVTTDAVDAVTGNDLIAGTGAAVATIDGDYTNMILNNVSGIGFYLAAGKTVAANRAYLHILTTLAPEALAPMMMVFDGEATGISDIKTMRNAENEIFFDLQGRKVAQPAKGLYIVNGKKVVIK